MSDYVVSPTYVPDLVHANLDLLLDDARGIWHLANPGAVTWSELALIAARHGRSKHCPTHTQQKFAMEIQLLCVPGIARLKVSGQISCRP